jgi:hypothetical protein
VLLARARAAIRSGRDTEPIGRTLVSIGHLSEEAKAAGGGPAVSAGDGPARA